MYTPGSDNTSSKSHVQSNRSPSNMSEKISFKLLIRNIQEIPKPI